MTNEEINPGASEGSNPENGSKPASSPNNEELNKLKSTVAELTEKYETIKRQYSGSSEEAVRLKKELEQKTKEIEGFKKPSTKISLNDDAFNQLVEKEGTVVAVQKVVEELFKPYASKIDKVYEGESKKIMQNFKANHPGIEGEAEVKFTKELERLKGVYETLDEALEAAYVLSGVRPSQDSAQKNLKEASEKEKEEILKKAQGGSQDSKGVPIDPNAEIKTKLEDLRFKALMAEAEGRDSMSYWAEIDKLNMKLASKV